MMCHFYHVTVCNAMHGTAKVFCLSVKNVDCDKTKQSCAHILIPHEKLLILVFWQKERLMGATPTIWNFGPNWPRWSENTNFQSIFAHSASALFHRIR